MKTRFCPSPTGFMHLGNLRTALFSALYTRSNNGEFLLRIEDTDAERSEEKCTEAVMRDLHWLGLEWDEGPEKDKGNGPYFQYERQHRGGPGVRQALYNTPKGVPWLIFSP